MVNCTTSLQLVVIATDRGSPQQLSSLARLTVRVTDRNDNPPMFEQVSPSVIIINLHGYRMMYMYNQPHTLQALYTGSQNENTAIGTSILSVLARDIDQTGTANAIVEYSLVSGDVDYFRIDPTTGVVSNEIVLVSYIPVLSASAPS